MEQKVKFDKEYATQWLKEVDYLKTVGIEPTFDKEINGVKTYKYTKNKKLFEALAKFHN
ncbi:hypothetical protein [Clostridium beijerinckii]|nr:hypothetical protein [Clostridium beijerinckii]NYB95462.1 hypothetical protein [Clostridium beijerinckii]OOM24577.1 hypothetical protein CLBEI_20380 [Clostridium beijerinckii]SQB00606.1 Uncharacterised protein [Clostridium beijerinckii]